MKSKFKPSGPFWQVISLGMLAGMRSTSAPAVASHILSDDHSNHLSKSPLNFMQSKSVANALKAALAGELITDKLPFTPDRIKTSSVIVRCLAGSLAGASVYKACKESPVKGALLGGTAAVLSTFGSFYLRKAVVSGTKLSDPVVGAIEDALVLTAGAALIYTA